MARRAAGVNGMKELIEAYTHCPVCGGADYELVAVRRRRCALCGFTDYNNPVCAVAAAIMNPAGELLLIRRARDPSAGKLTMPGGFVDAWESLEEALRREVAEETGLEVGAMEYLTSHPNGYIHHGVVRPVTDAFFVARVDVLDVRLAPEEATEWLHLPVRDIAPESLAFDSIRHAVEVLKVQVGG